MVKVWGKLLIEKIVHEPQGKSPSPKIPPPPIAQEIEGPVMRTILKAKWKLVKS